MPSCTGDVTINSPIQTDTEKSPKKRRRISRACDCCRLKKSKVVPLARHNSTHWKLILSSVTVPESARLVKIPTVHVSIVRDEIGESSILQSYTTSINLQVHSEAKNYVWHVRDITDEALIRLYWACQNGTGFPGAAIEEKDSQVTSHTVLKALGLTCPVDDETSTNYPQTSPTELTCRLQALQRKSTTPPSTPGDSAVPTTANCVNSRANSTGTIDTTSPNKQTRLQHRFHQQLQYRPTPTKHDTVRMLTMDGSSSILITGWSPPHAQRPSMPLNQIPFASSHFTDHTRRLAPPPPTSNPQIAPNPTRLAPTPTPYIETLHPNSFLASQSQSQSQFVDFDTACIPPSWNFELFDFPPQPQSHAF